LRILSQIKSFIMEINKSSDSINQTKKMKRKKFFLTSAFAAAGIFTFTKFPFGILKAKVLNEKKSSLKITENPNAVKRKSNRYGNA